MTQTILNALAPHLLEILGGLLTLLIGWAAARFSAWSGIQIEARHREALHTALMSGARLALSKGLTGQTAIDVAVGYAQRSVPDAVARLRPAEMVLETLARTKIHEVGEAYRAGR